VTFDGRSFTSLFVTTNSVIAFGQPDGTFHDFPMTPSISLFSQDWVAYPQARPTEAFTIAHSHQGFQVTLKVRPYGNQATPTLTTIVFTAAYNQDRTLNISYYAENVSQYQTRTGVRLNNGTVVPFSQAGITQETTIPVVPGEPEPDPAPAITGTEVGDSWAKVFVQSSSAVTATAWRYQVANTQQACVNPYSSQTITTNTLSESILLSGLTNGCQYTVRVAHWDGDESLYAETVVTPVIPFLAVPTNVQATLEGNSIILTWDAPTGNTVPIERYSIFWSYNNFETGFAISSTTTSATINNVPNGVTVSIKVRADNDSRPTYSDFSQPVLMIIPPAPPPTPTPTPEPSPEPTPESTPTEPGPGSVEPTPTPEQPEPQPEPTPPIVDPSPPAVIPESPAIPNPEETLEPETEPETVPPTEESTPEPTPSEKPVEEPEENEPEPLPEPEPSSPTEIFGELENISPEDLSEEQMAALLGAALATFETAEEGSAEYEAALDALAILAQADDPQLPEMFEGIPGAEEILAAFNALGNIGADMSPEVREEAEKVVVTAIVAVNAALSAAMIINAATPPVPSAPTGGATTSGSGPAARGKV
jgi:hypothetical protein